MKLNYFKNKKKYLFLKKHFQNTYIIFFLLISIDYNSYFIIIQFKLFMLWDIMFFIIVIYVLIASSFSNIFSLSYY